MKFEEYAIEKLNIEVIDGDRGKNYPHKEELLEEGYCLFLSANNVTGNGFEFINNVFIDENKDRQLNNGKLLRNDIVITTRGTVGNVAIYDSSVPYDNVRINSGMLIIRCGKGINPLFLYYVLKSNAFYNQIKAIQTGTAQPQLPKSHFLKMQIPLPQYKIQCKIASILKSLDDKIALNNAINNNLEQQARAIFKAWFIDYEPFGGITPKNWSPRKLSDIADFIGGYSYKGSELTESSTAMATIKNFDRKGGFKLDGFKEIIPSDKVKPSQFINIYDILVAHTDLTQNAEVIGNAEIVMSLSNYKNAVFSMDLVKVVPKKDTFSRFLLAAILRNSYFKAHCLGYINGTTVLHLNKKALPEYELMLPNDLSLLNNLDETITAIYLKISSNMEENLKLTKLRDMLLPKLISGELDVSDIDI